MKKNHQQEISRLLSQMTLEEKVGQLRQCGPSLVGAFEISFEELLNMMFDGGISQEEFQRLVSTATQDFHEEDLRAGRIGSYNGIKDAETADRLQHIAVEETRLGIPLLFGYDVIHGYRTITPIPLGEACSWDPELWRRTARLAAREASAAGVHMTFAPMVDVAKDARWGRVSEGAGEDTLLAADYGVAKVQGFQGDALSRPDTLAACVKHFAAYGAAEAGRDYNRVDLSQQRLWEDYLPPFEACVRAGARGIMPAFNDLNGVPCTVNGWLLLDVLREQWGFDGLTVSDSHAIAECVDHGVAEDLAEAARQSLEAGLEMDMSSDAYSQHLVRLVQQGKVSMDALDRAVAHVLGLKFELGLFEHPYRTRPEQGPELPPEARALAREAAEKSMVLLKNDGVLPLKSGLRIGLAGPLAEEAGEMLGAWAIGGRPEDCVSLLEGLKARGETVVPLREERWEEQIRDCDVLVAAVGESKNESGEAASRACIELPRDQIRLLERLLETGKPVVAVLFNGRPLALPWVAEHVPAILEAWHPGVEAGNAIADVLFGTVNPSGKLTTTFPHTTGQCPVYYSQLNTGRPGGKGKFTSKYLDTPLEPVYPFGYGLSYTSFDYRDLSLEPGREAVAATVTVRNTGDRAGDEIVQCYFRDPVARRARPVKKLVDYARVSLAPGEEQEVCFTIPYEKLGYYDMEMRYVVEPGAFVLFVGPDSLRGLSQSFTLE